MNSDPSGLLVPIPTEPLDTRSLSVPSVVTLKCPSEPVSTTSASVFPSEILSPADPPPPPEPATDKCHQHLSHL